MEAFSEWITALAHLEAGYIRVYPNLLGSVGMAGVTLKKVNYMTFLLEQSNLIPLMAADLSQIGL